MLNAFPLIYRELLVAGRGGATRGYQRWLVALLSGAAALGLTYLSREQDSWPLGRYLFYAVFGYVLIHLGVTTRGLCGRFFSEDRRHRTLGLLFLTGLRPGEILLGKLAGVYTTVLFPVLGAVPLLAYAMLMGGLSDGAFVASVETLLVLPLLVMSIQMTASILTQDEHAAEVLALGIIGALVLGPPVVLVAVQIVAGNPPSPDWYTLGPANAPWQLMQDTRDARLDAVFLGNALTVSYATGFLVLSGWLLKRAWRSELEGEAEGLERGTVWSRLQKRAAARARGLLEKHPYAWLVARDGRAALLPWLVLPGLCVAWLAGWAAWPTEWLTPFTCWATCLVLGALASGVVHYAAGRQIAEDRRSGALELLLTTTLNPAGIVEGQEAAVRQMTGRFLTVVAALYGWFFVLGILTMQEWSLPSLVNYGAFWSVLVWMGPWARKGGYWQTFWVSLNTGRLAYGLRRQAGALLGCLPMLIIFYANGTLFALLNAPADDSAISALLATGAVVILLVWYFIWREQLRPLREKAVEEFRHIAAQPVPAAGDPRLKQWSNLSEALFPPEKAVDEEEYPSPIRIEPAPRL